MVYHYIEDFYVCCNCTLYFRYKYHMVDLVYLEKISRWMLNTQVKIKGEVTLSNTSAQAIASALNNFERQLDACERPSPDKQVRRN